jgi:hypothetical protein
MLLMALLAVFSPLANANTHFSQLLAHVQATYLPKADPYPILIMDRDELEWRFTLAGALSATDAPKREAILQAYVKEKTGVAISANAAANFEPYLTQLKDAAVAMPALKADQATVEMCAVFPPDPNRNQNLELERLTQLRTQEAYGPREATQLRYSMAYDDLILFSVLHESGHCLDKTYFPQLIGGQDDAGTIHGAESFAETTAVFLMAKEGHQSVAVPRAYLRDLYSYFMEPYFASHPEFGFGSEAFSYGGLIYHLSPSLLAAGALVSGDPSAIRDLPLAGVLALAAGVVEKNAFDSRFLTALYVGYTEGHEATAARYKSYEAQMPDLFGGYVANLQRYWQADTDFRAGAFVSAPPPSAITELKPFDQAFACEALHRNDIDALRGEIDGLRLDLRAGHPSFESASARFSLLSDLWKNLPALCNGRKSVVPVVTKLLRPIPLIDAVVPRPHLR